MGCVAEERGTSPPNARPTPSKPGTLLVAAPALTDANFARTVVFVIDHRREGTLGVVLNRPSEVEVGDVLPTWGPYTTRPSAIFVGGPVEQKTALCLAALRTGEDPERTEGVVGVRGPVALVDLDGDPGSLAPRVRGLRVFAGYAGWDRGQLARRDRARRLVRRARAARRRPRPAAPRPLGRGAAPPGRPAGPAGHPRRGALAQLAALVCALSVRCLARKLHAHP